MYLNQNITGHWECFNAAVGGGRRRQRYRLESPHSKPKLSAAGQVVVESLALIKKPNQPPADVLSLHITDFLFKKKKKKEKRKSIFSPLSPRQWGISRSKMSRLQGSTVNTCRILSPPQLSVSTSAGGSQCRVSVAWRRSAGASLKTGSPELSAGCGSPQMPCSLHHSKPIFD